MTKNTEKFSLHEPRKDIRIPLLLKVEFQEPATGDIDHTLNLSASGMFVNTNAPLNVKQAFKCKLSFPGLLEPCFLQGIVRWKRESDPWTTNNNIGVGTEFIFANEKDKSQLQKFVDNIIILQSSIPKEFFTPFKILLVDDTKLVHDMFNYALENFYQKLESKPLIEISNIYDGQAALDYLDHEDPDLAIIDYFLPHVTGETIVKNIRSRKTTLPTKHLPIFAISADGPKAKENALKAGADLFLPKPLFINHILNTAHLLLHQKNLVSKLIR